VRPVKAAILGSAEKGAIGDMASWKRSQDVEMKPCISTMKLDTCFLYPKLQPFNFTDNFGDFSTWVKK
jgi:hypothetical protein